MKIGIAVIGCGYWGPNLTRNFSQIEPAELRYICDIDEKKMAPIKKTYPYINTTKDYEEILKDPKVDAVVIALPVAKHYQIAKDALLHNKHVLIEKPMTSNSKEAEELIKIAKENGKIIMVDHTFEYSESINKIKGIIEAKELGDIYYMRANWLNLGLLQPDVNVIWDLVPHISSIINYISNLKPLSVSANAGAYIRKDIPEVANIHIKFSKEVTAYITVGWLEPRKTRSMTIVGSKKMLVYDLTNDEEPIKIYDKSVNLAEEIKDTRQFRVNYSYGDIHSPNVRNIESLRTMCLHFVDCIVNNKKPRSDGESGANVIKILEAAEESLKNNGKEVKLE